LSPLWWNAAWFFFDGYGLSAADWWLVVAEEEEHAG